MYVRTFSTRTRQHFSEALMPRSKTATSRFVGGQIYGSFNGSRTPLVVAKPSNICDSLAKYLWKWQTKPTPCIRVLRENRETHDRWNTGV